jgi:predicted amidophosphoribosyltransferase
VVFFTYWETPKEKRGKMNCNLCGNAITNEEEALCCLPFGAICEDCANEIESSKEYKPKSIKPEQLERVISIINNQKGE